MQAALLSPRYWPTWLAMGIMRLLAWLPYSWGYAIGAGLGSLVRRLPVRFVAIARRNIELCLPELTLKASAKLLAQHFRSLGIAVCETALAWYAADSKLRPLVH